MKLGKLLLKFNLISNEDILEALKKQSIDTNKKIGEILLEKGLIDEKTLIKYLAMQLDYEFLETFINCEIANNVSYSKDESFYWKNCCCLIKRDDKIIFVFNNNTQDINGYIGLLLLNNIPILLGTKEDIYNFLSNNIETTLDVDNNDIVSKINEFLEIGIIKQVSNLRIKKSIESYAILIDTDIGIEVIKVFSLDTGNKIIRIVAERCGVTLSPNESIDGKFINGYVSKLTKKHIDIRVEFFPVANDFTADFSYEAVLRFHGIKSFLGLESLGFGDDEVQELNEVLTYASGLVLSVGPTGAGKSTTFYALLKNLSTKRLPIMTIEDPVEIRLNEINITQMTVNDTFRYSNALIAMLRGEPKIMMIGEMRDKETAAATIMAAQTGHLVLSTLHTTSAINVISRLEGLNINKSDFLEVIKLIVSQRLYLPLCPECRELETNMNPIWVESLKKHNIDIHVEKIYKGIRGNNCKLCLGTGYLPKHAIIEILHFNDNIKKSILNNINIEYNTLNNKAKALIRHGLIDVNQYFNITG
jgi:type IV pilus assembly protein PilB